MLFVDLLDGEADAIAHRLHDDVVSVCMLYYALLTGISPVCVIKLLSSSWNKIGRPQRKTHVSSPSDSLVKLTHLIRRNTIDQYNSSDG